MATLRELRVQRFLSLRQVADRLGISHVFMGEIERGIRPLPARHTEALAELFGVPLEEVRGRAPERIDLSDLPPAERERVATFVAEIRAARSAT